MTGTSLAFVDTRADLAAAVARALRSRPRRVVLRTALVTETADDILAVARSLGVPAGFDSRDRPADHGAGASLNAPTIDGAAPSDDELVVVLEGHGAAVAGILMDYVDRFGVEILALKTDRHFSRRPLLFTSIPKSGTHLVLGLLTRFGYVPKPDPRRRRSRARGYAHELMRDRMLGEHLVGTFGPQAPALAGGIVHPIGEPSFHMPFWRVFGLLSEMGVRRTQLTELPILFSYRHPLGVLLSESSAYADPVSHILGHYFASFTSTDERCHDLIRGNGITSLVDRLASYVAWLRMANVIPISFEELAGPRGGGDATLQRQLIWSLQLKLQIPGDPVSFAETAYNPSSRTFRRGRVDAFVDELTDHRAFLQQYPRLVQLCRDFGFDPDADGQPLGSRHCAGFRRRPPSAQAPPAVADPPVPIASIGGALRRLLRWLR